MYVLPRQSTSIDVVFTSFESGSLQRKRTVAESGGARISDAGRTLTETTVHGNNGSEASPADACAVTSPKTATSSRGPSRRCTPNDCPDGAGSSGGWHTLTQDRVN